MAKEGFHYHCVTCDREFGVDDGYMGMLICSPERYDHVPFRYRRWNGVSHVPDPAWAEPCPGDCDMDDHPRGIYSRQEVCICGQRRCPDRRQHDRIHLLAIREALTRAFPEPGDPDRT